MSYTDHIFVDYRRRVKELDASNNPFSKGIAYIAGEYVPLRGAHSDPRPGFLHSDLTYDVPAVWKTISTVSRRVVPGCAS